MPGKVYVGTIGRLVGQDITFTFKENAFSGYQWTAEFDSRFAEQTKNELTVSENEDTGDVVAARQFCFKFTAAGNTDLTFTRSLPRKGEDIVEQQAYKIIIRSSFPTL